MVEEKEFELSLVEGPVVPVLLYVPTEQVLEVQAKLPGFLATIGATTASTGGYEPPYPATHGGHDAWTLQPWALGDEAAACWILSVLGEGQRRILAALLGAGTKGFWTSELRNIGGYSDDTRMSGPFKAIAGRFRRTGRRPLWNGNKVKDPMKGQLLWVGDETARMLFAVALVSDWPDVAAEFAVIATP